MLRWVVVLMACSGIGNRLALADPLPDAVQRKVTRLELARSIRAFATGTLGNATCLIDKGELNRRQADAAMRALHSVNWGSIQRCFAIRRWKKLQNC